MNERYSARRPGYRLLTIDNTWMWEVELIAPKCWALRAADAWTHDNSRVERGTHTTLTAAIADLRRQLGR